jgi:hypothetical protein
MNYPFCYKIKYFKNYLNSEAPVKTEQCGLVYAGTYPEAVQKICDWYGEDHLSDINMLVALEDDPIILPEEILNKIIKDEYFKEV